MSQDFYLRYYVGHKGKFGHEFLEFEYRPDGKFIYCLLSVIFILINDQVNYDMQTIQIIKMIQ